MSNAVHFSRRPYMRCTAALGVLMAASWGPLAHTLKFVETSERGERTVRVVLAQSYAAQHENKAQSKNAKPDAKKDSSHSERLLNAVPDSLEAAQSIHFEFEAPELPVAIALADRGEAQREAFEFAIPYTQPPDISLARGPPA